MFNVENHVSRETVQSAGKRRYRRKANGICGTCRERPRREGQGDCDICHALSQKEYRLRKRLEADALRAKLAEYEQKLEGQTNGQSANEDKG